MTHETLVGQLQAQFPELVDWRLADWFPSGKDTVRIRLTDGTEMVFTYHDPQDWRLESVDSYLNTLSQRG